MEGGKGILQVEKFNQGWKKCGVGERVNPISMEEKILWDKYYLLSCLSYHVKRLDANHIMLSLMLGNHIVKGKKMTQKMIL